MKTTHSSTADLEMIGPTEFRSLLKLSREIFERRVKSGDILPPIWLGPKTRRWFVTDARRFMAAKPASLKPPIQYLGETEIEEGMADA